MRGIRGHGLPSVLTLFFSIFSGQAGAQTSPGGGVFCVLASRRQGEVRRVRRAFCPSLSSLWLITSSFIGREQVAPGF